jgi:hypothetical protein
VAQEVEYLPELLPSTTKKKKKREREKAIFTPQYQFDAISLSRLKYFEALARDS